MGMRVSQTCLQSLLLPHAASSSQPFASLAPSHSSSKTTAGAISTNHSVFLTDHVKLWRGSSLGSPAAGRGRRRKEQSLRRALSASLESFKDGEDDDEEFVRRLQELVLELRQGDEDLGPQLLEYSSRDLQEDASPSSSSSSSSSSWAISPEPWIGIGPEPNWPDKDEVVPASVERNANSVELPLSLRIIKQKKKRWEEAGESACCSIKRAFSSMVFIIQELQSHVLQMREVGQDLQGILARVHQEMHSSFVWLFQHIFSCTPTLMVSIMLLLANYTVYSMSHGAAFATTMPPNPPAHCETIVSVMENHHQQKDQKQPNFDPSSVKTFSISGRTASFGGEGGGGGGRKVTPVGGATDDGRSDGSSLRYSQSPTIFSDIPSLTTVMTTEEEAVVTEEAEAVVWGRLVEEASRMQASTRDESLMDHETLQRLVSPVRVELAPDDYYSDYFRTELEYHLAVSQDPNNSLLLSNFAQFLFHVLHDSDRAEHYFKRAVRIEPVDAEALNRYASFLWLARKDLGAAEDTYLEAISADPSNPVYAASYAHFLWNTGGEDTCYPIDGSDAAAAAA